MNIEKFPDPLFVRVLMKLYGLRIGLDVRRGIARRGFEDRQAFRDWAIERFSGDRRSVLIPCHGAIDNGDALNARMIALMKRRFS